MANMAQSTAEKRRMASEEIATMDRLIAKERDKLQKMRDNEANPRKVTDQLWYLKALENSVAGMRRDLDKAESAPMSTRGQRRSR
jgi:hypothetical protein